MVKKEDEENDDDGDELRTTTFVDDGDDGASEAEVLWNVGHLFCGLRASTI